jgi:uncharacterized damage-inducible protein DinB
MSAGIIARPGESEHAAYYRTYVSKVPDGDVVALLGRQVEETLALVARLDEEGARYRYAPGKWSIKDVLCHLTDSERVFCYRALRFARGDVTPLPGFEQDDWARETGAEARPLGDLVDEFRAVRRATLAFARSLTPATAARKGTAAGAEVTVRALIWIIAGHERHHATILREKYGLG